MAVPPPLPGYASPLPPPPVPGSPYAVLPGPVHHSIAHDLAVRDMHEKGEINRSTQKMLAIIDAEKDQSAKAKEAEATAAKLAAAAMEQVAAAAQAVETARQAKVDHTAAVGAAGAAAANAAAKQAALDSAQEALAAAQEAVKHAETESEDATTASAAAAEDAAAKQVALITALSEEEKQRAQALEAEQAAASAAAAVTAAQGAVVQCSTAVAAAVAELNAQRTRNHATESNRVIHSVSPQRARPFRTATYPAIPPAPVAAMPVAPPPLPHSPRRTVLHPSAVYPTPVHAGLRGRQSPPAPPRLLRYTSPPLSPMPPGDIDARTSEMPLAARIVGVERDLAMLLEKVDGLDPSTAAALNRQYGESFRARTNALSKLISMPPPSTTA